MIEKSANMTWFKGWSKESKAGAAKGFTLLEAIDSIEPPVRPSDKPLRLPLQDVYKIGGIGTVPVGRVETGVIKAGMVVTFAPANVTTEVKRYSTSSVITQIRANDAVLKCTTKPWSKVSQETTSDSTSRTFPSRKSVVVTCAVTPRTTLPRVASHSTPKSLSSTIPVKSVLDTLQSWIVTLPTSPVNSLNCWRRLIVDPARSNFPRLLRTRLTYLRIEDAPKFVKSGDAAIVKMVPSKPMCVEAFTDYPPLGRFAVRDMRQTVAVGVIKSVEKTEKAGKVTKAAQKATGKK